jgi:hypothetical protein
LPHFWVAHVCAERSKKRLRVIKSFTEVVTMMTCPRSFGYADVPEYEGAPLLSAYGDAPYAFYCGWLVDYLDHVASMPVPASQLELCRCIDIMQPASAVWTLGNDGFYHYDTYAALACRIEEGLTYEQAERELRAFWEETWGEVDPEDAMPFSDYITPDFWQEAKREYAEEHAMPIPVRHFDVGYRVPLARTLARVPSRQERIKLINRFYASYNEEASK